jgi:hypothetical protein
VYNRKSNPLQNPPALLGVFCFEKWALPIFLLVIVKKSLLSLAQLES